MPFFVVSPAQVLIIDEVSMLFADLLDKVNAIFRAIHVSVLHFPSNICYQLHD